MAIISGTINVPAAGTRVQATHVGNARTVVFKAREANVNNIYVGGSTVASTAGMTLPPGQAVTLQLLDAISTSQFWADADTNANKVDFLAVE